jgi:hypothetical protein
MKKCYLPVVMIVTACSSDHHPQTVDASVVVDTPPMIDADETSTVTVDLEGSDPPLFVAYQDGARAWQAIDPTTSPLVLRVHDDYQLLAVCGDASDGFDTGIQASTIDDGPTVGVPCFQFTSPATTPVTASGTVVQPGSVSIGVTQSSATPNWPFSLTVAKGMHTLVAISATKAIVQNGLDLEADTTLPNIDISAGAALVPVTFTVADAAPGATLDTQLRESLANDFTFLPSVPGTTAHALPASLLSNTDVQTVAVSAASATTFQTALQQVNNTTVTAIDMIPTFSGVTFTTGKASWTAPLPAGDLEFDAVSLSSFNLLFLTPSSRWLGTKTELSVDTSVIPGFRPEWAVDTSPQSLSLDVLRDTGGLFLISEVFPASSFTAQHAKDRHRRRGGSLRR